MQPEVDRLKARLEEIAGRDQVQAGSAVVGFSVDGVSPTLGVHAASQEQVASIVRACADPGAAIIPWGGGTAMGLGNRPARTDVALVLDRLNRIVEFDAANLNVTVEAGMRLADLQAELAKQRQFLPLDPPAEDRATVGGMLAANQSGPSRLLYGTARDWVLGMRVALPDGERIRCGGKVIKNVSGYDMNKLFVGSLGTLGIITEATFKLLPLPAVRRSVAGVFAALGQAAGVVAKVLDSVLLPEALELLDLDAVALLGPALGLDATGYGLAVSLAGSRETVERQVRDFTGLFREAQARATTTLPDERTGPAWKTIRNAFDLLPGPPPERVTCKIAVPISRTAEMLAAAEEFGRRARLRAAGIAHAGSGVVRACYLLGPEAPPAEVLASGLQELRRVSEAAEGSLTLHAAPAALKVHLDAWGKPAGGPLDVMRRLKMEFDPRGLCNPGRFLGGI
jgi:glycolate oxidase FAD binding subunit